MKRAGAWLGRLYASEAGRWALGAAAALALYLLAVCVQSVITFYDNDDLNIAWALAGYRSGAPSFSHPFLNPLTAAAVSALYALVPAVPWWYAVQTACMLLSATVMAACTLKLGKRSGLPMLAPLLVIALLFAAACYYAVAQVTFTLTSTLLGMGAVAFALSADDADPPARARFYRAAGVGMLGLSLLIRQSSGLCAACFYFGALAIRLAEALLVPSGAKAPNKRALPGAGGAVEPGDAPAEPSAPAALAPRVRRLLTTAVCAALVLAALSAVNGWGRANQNPDGFLPFENARAEFMDYPHDAYHENPALYDSLGWDGALYDLVNAWFYMDARVNADTLEKASAQSLVNNLAAPERAARGIRAFSEFLGKYPLARYLCAVLACAAAAVLVTALLCRSHPLPAFGGLCMLLGAAALTAFLLWQGRMNLRTLMTIAFPAILALLLLTFLAFERRRAAKADGKPGLTRARGAALGCVCGALAAAALFCGYKIFRTTASYDSTAALDEAHAVVDYALAHPENVYLRDVYVGNNFDALTVYPQRRPVNLIDWGGCDMYTRARLAQWRVNGYDESPFADVLFDADVYYICDPNAPYLAMLDGYLTADWGAAGYEITDTLPSGAVVVKFLR